MSRLDLLPEELTRHFRDGLLGPAHIWLVLPRTSDSCGWDGGAEGVNAWLPTLEDYPASLEHIVWYDDDGSGNMLGWDPATGDAVLWNPGDDEPMKRGTVAALWRHVSGEAP